MQRADWERIPSPPGRLPRRLLREPPRAGGPNRPGARSRFIKATITKRLHARWFSFPCAPPSNRSFVDVRLGQDHVSDLVARLPLPSAARLGCSYLLQVTDHPGGLRAVLLCELRRRHARILSECP